MRIISAQTFWKRAYIYTAASLQEPVVSGPLLPCVKRPQFTLNWLPVVRCYYWNRKWEILGKTNIQGEIDGERETDKHEHVPDNSTERQHQGQTDLIAIHSSHWCTCTLTARLAGLTVPLCACLSYQGFQHTVGSQHPKDELERFPKQQIQEKPMFSLDKMVHMWSVNLSYHIKTHSDTVPAVNFPEGISLDYELVWHL